MSVLYVVLPISIVLVVIAVVLFVWAVRRGQFDDLETPGVRMLHDDEPVRRRRGEEGEKPESDRAGDDDDDAGRRS